jgi:hypothetical protein
VNKEENEECPTRGHRSGSKYFKFYIPFVKVLPLWRWMPQASLMPVTISNAELNGLALIPGSPSRLPVIICSSL